MMIGFTFLITISHSTGKSTDGLKNMFALRSDQLSSNDDWKNNPKLDSFLRTIEFHICIDRYSISGSLVCHS